MSYNRNWPSPSKACVVVGYLEASGAVWAYCWALQVGSENGLTLNGDDTRPPIPVDNENTL